MFFGDSYSLGVGARSAGQRWTSLVSEELGWTEDNRALGGTGYQRTPPYSVCGLSRCPRYADVVRSVAAQGSDPDVVVIAGGQNDAVLYALDPAREEAAIRQTYQRAATAFPGARIIGVGPSWPSGEDPWARRMDHAVARAVRDAGGTHISLLDPPVVGPGLLLADGIHVGAAGHEAIAGRVLDGLLSAPAAGS